MVSDRRHTNLFHGIDHLFVIVTAVLLIGGLVMLASASMPIAVVKYGDPYGYVYKQILAISLGLTAGLVVFLVPSRIWEKFGILLPILALCLLVLVFIPGLGHDSHGAYRWIKIGPLPNIQVVDPARLLLLIYISGYCYRQQETLTNDFMSFVKPMIFIIPACLLLLGQPDFGSTVIILSVTAGLFFIAGFKIRYFLALIIILGLTFAFLIYIEPYRMSRLAGFLEPWKDSLGAGYQLTNSLIAIGSGGIFGVGLGESIQKLFYLPEAHTDFIFAIIAEELGLMGTVLILSLYGLLISRIFVIGFKAIRSELMFQGYLCISIGIWLSLQVIINLGVNMGLLPTKGLTLPLISYGSSSIAITLITLAMVLRIGCENPQPKKNVRTGD